ncbi:MAG TPA: Mur ligase family protein [Candidatus Limnocylindria bacterium]|nr:Mur ligase family protein [Candidatus Limnocylindria bacterium]
MRELTSRGRFGVSLGLERISAILDELDHPERALRGALVGGTNGKGSVVAMVRSVLEAAGLRVGTMPKPHLVSYRERIAIDGTPLSEAAFAAAVRRVLPGVDRVTARLGPPTEFETLTAAAFIELARQRVDLAVVEVGMGGRLDATNVLDPGVAAITNVQKDHERFLGSTLAAIGAEKAAIVKPGDLAVSGATGRGLAPIEARCASLGVPLRLAGRRRPYRTDVLRHDLDGLVLDAFTPGRTLGELRVGLLGRHQAQNAAVALAVLDALREDGERRGQPLEGLDEDAIRRGMADARWPGRLELLPDTPQGRILLDGAHNPAGARALAAALEELGLNDLPTVFGATRGKRVADMLRALAAARPRPVFTAIRDAAALPPEELLQIWRRVTGTRGGAAVAEPWQALERAAAMRRESQQPVLVAGSLYLVGALRGELLPEGPVP